jgi:hypothetical protein
MEKLDLSDVECSSPLAKLRAADVFAITADSVLY